MTNNSLKRYENVEVETRYEPIIKNENSFDIVERCESSQIEVSLLSRQDKNQQLPFSIELMEVSKKKIDERNNKIKDTWLSAYHCPGSYILHIHPEVGQSFRYYKDIDYRKDFEFPVFLRKDQKLIFMVYVTRRGSIVFDIHYNFYVEDNPKASPFFFNTRDKGLGAWRSGSLISYDPYLRSAASEFSVKFGHLRTIAMLEMEMGWYDKIKEVGENLPIIGDRLQRKSYLPMNVHAGYWHRLWSRDELLKVNENTRAGAFLLKRLNDRVIPNEFKRVSSLWPNLTNIKIDDYGLLSEKEYFFMKENGKVIGFD